MPDPTGPGPSPDQWNERYGAEDYTYGTAPNDFLVASAGHIPPGRVLCLAEGEGRNAVYLAGAGYDVTAVDWSEAGLAKARQLAEANDVRITTVCADLADYTIEPDSWSGIVTIFGHLHHEIRARLYREIPGGLVPGGAFILEAYTPDQIGRGTGGPPVAAFTMDLASLEQELAGLDFIVGRETLRDIREGSRHSGEGAVVQIVAVKPGQ